MMRSSHCGIDILVVHPRTSSPRPSTSPGRAERGSRDAALRSIESRNATSRCFLTMLLAVSVCITTGTAGCKRNDPQAEAAAATAQRAATEDAAAQAGKAFDDAMAKENWPLAKAQGDVLLAQYPESAAAARIRPLHAEAVAKADAARDQSRMAALWAYNVETVKGGKQLSASIYAKDDVDTDGSGPKQVRLIFRDHPSWGKSAYMTLQAGDFDCYGGCRVQVRAGDAPAKAMAASRPDTDEAIAMFIEDERALWRMTKDARTLAIEFPVKGLGRKTAVFEVGGLDRSRLPKWD